MIKTNMGFISPEGTIDSRNMGRPLYFDVEAYLDCVEMMICSDEIERAFHMLDNLPAWYRDNVPERAKAIRETVYRQLMTVSEYALDSDELDISPTNFAIDDMIHTHFCSPRGPMVMNTIKKMNEDGIEPFLFEFGPANFWLPHGLAKEGLKFNYKSSTINNKSMNIHKQKLESVWADGPKPGQATIFICFEVIEHLWNESDIFHEYCKLGFDADVIMISTPKYTMSCGLPDWDTRQLGHIRAYTPQDLFFLCNKFWPGRPWEYHEDMTMMVIGRK